MRFLLEKYKYPAKALKRIKGLWSSELAKSGSYDIASTKFAANAAKSLERRRSPVQIWSGPS